MSNNIIELFTIPTTSLESNWATIVNEQHCPLIAKKCDKIRKSEPDIAIGTCTVNYGVREPKDVIICPHRFLERGQIFIDCIHLLTLHEPGNELHKIAEVQIPGGNIDYMLVSVDNGNVVDFVGIELQALDTTGSLWSYRQELLHNLGIIAEADIPDKKTFGMNWKMTAKTILMQLHHKIETFQAINRHLVLIMQDTFLDYVRSEFQFDHIDKAKQGHPLHFHSYSFNQQDSDNYRIKLDERLSTDTDGFSKALGLRADANIEFEAIIEILQNKISDDTRLEI